MGHETLGTGSYDIYELVEEKEALKWSYLAKFGNRTYEFPQIITPINGGEFIFLPKRIIYINDDPTFFDPPLDPFESIEVWKMNQALNRSTMELSLNSTANLA